MSKKKCLKWVDACMDHIKIQWLKKRVNNHEIWNFQRGINWSIYYYRYDELTTTLKRKISWVPFFKNMNSYQRIIIMLSLNTWMTSSPSSFWNLCHKWMFRGRAFLYCSLTWRFVCYSPFILVSISVGTCLQTRCILHRILQSFDLVELCS